MKRRLAGSALLGALTILVSTQLVSAAQGEDLREEPPGPTAGVRIATGLAGTLGSTVGPDGALYVPESATGSVSRIDPWTGEKTVVAEGLPHNAEGGGPVDAVFTQLKLYVLVSGVAPDAAVGVYLVNDDGSTTLVADLGQYALDNPVDFEDAAPTGNPFTIDALSQTELIVAESNHNKVLKIDLVSHEISTIASYGNVVPTGLEPGNGFIYISEIGAFPHVAQTGRVLAVRTLDGETTEVAGGVSYVIDVEAGPSNRLYALSFGDQPTDFEGRRPPRSAASCCWSTVTARSRRLRMASRCRPRSTSSATRRSSRRLRATCGGSTTSRRCCPGSHESRPVRRRRPAGRLLRFPSFPQQSSLTPR